VKTPLGLVLAQAKPFYCLLTTWYVFAGGWVHGVSFSASGNKLAWVGHDSSISVVNAANECKMATIQGDFLPFAACVWVTENSIITAGNDCPFVIGIMKQLVISSYQLTRLSDVVLVDFRVFRTFVLVPNGNSNYMIMQGSSQICSVDVTYY